MEITIESMRAFHTRSHQRARRARSGRQGRLARIITFLGLSLLLHLALLGVGVPLWPLLQGEPDFADGDPVEVTLVEPEPKPEPEPEPPEYEGQIVDLPKPQEEQEPEEADYLAEHSRDVEKETRTRRYEVNPEVLAPSHSKEQKLQFEDLADINATEPSTGAQVGNDRFDPDRDGALASLPSPFAITNKEGLEKPVPSSHREQDLAGSPNNDLLDEETGTAVNLNTREFLFASYLNRIRRLVNFYWQQNLDNLPPGLPLARSQYETRVDVVLTSEGNLESVRVTADSGSEPIDNCVVDAFEMAGPFPNPPEQLVDPDGRAFLPSFGFTVQVGQARAPYYGVDPRAGVQFPGILKSPH